MSDQTKTAQPPLPAGWRLPVGFSFFVISLICPVFIPLVTATDLPTEWKAGISGLLVFGIPQLLMLVAIAALGKPGFNYLKGLLAAYFKQLGPPKTVSRTRYRIGLAMFLLPLAMGWLTPYVSDLVPNFDAQHRTAAAMGDILLISSLFVLGGDFWDKLRALFNHEARAHFPAA